MYLVFDYPKRIRNSGRRNDVPPILHTRNYFTVFNSRVHPWSNNYALSRNGIRHSEYESLCIISPGISDGNRNLDPPHLRRDCECVRHKSTRSRLVTLGSIFLPLYLLGSNIPST